MTHQDRHGGYLEVGDVILYGKFKNAKGKIIGFGVNEKGDPTVEVQPVDKDGKPKKGQPKTLTLLKVRKMKKEASASTVVDIFVQKTAAGISLGKTWENGKVRVHRYSNNFQVHDLANAGKRGKKVRVMHIMPTTASMTEEAALLEQYNKYVVLNAGGGYDGIKRFFGNLPEFKIEESAERGIDVRPGDVRKIKMQWKAGEDELELTADPLEFRLRSSAPISHPKTGRPIGRQDTSYWSDNKKDAVKFYAWLLDGGEAKIKRMGIYEIRDLWSKIKVRYDSH